MALLLAVLETRCRISVAKRDVYASAVGGVRIVEPAGDLAIAISVASALHDRSVPADLVACGEVGLGGEVRQVGSTGRRLAEAARLGFRQAVVPLSAPDVPGIELRRVGTLAEAIQIAGAARQ